MEQNLEWGKAEKRRAETRRARMHAAGQGRGMECVTARREARTAQTGQPS